MKDGIDDSILRLLLVTLDPIRITTVVTSFRVVATQPSLVNGSKDRREGAEVRAPPPLTTGEEAPIHRRTISCGCAPEKPYSITLPLILEAIIDAKVLGKMANLAIQVPGTITGTIHPNDSLLTSVSVTLDAMALLQSMMGQARIIVKKGIRKAACISANFKKNAELGGVVGVRPPEINNDHDKVVSGGSTANPTVSSMSSTTSSSSLPPPLTPTSSSVMQEKLLTSYPNHLRQTVENFLPATENEISVSMEGFPSHLVNTSISLSKQRKSDSIRSSRGSVGSSGSEAGGSYSSSSSGGGSSLVIKDKECYGSERKRRKT